MKPKIALAKYLDWAVLAVLAVALIFVAVWSFLLKATGEEKLGAEVRQYDAAVQKGMNDTSAQPQPPRDYLSELRNRLEHPAVMVPYRHNPFLTREDIPYPPLQLRVSVPRTVKFKGTRFTEVVARDEKRMRVELAYDLPTGVSSVTFTPLEAGETTIRIQTDEDLVYLFKISVRTVKRPPPPNPPIDVVVVPRAAVEIRKVLQPAMVLISFAPDDPKELSLKVGFSNNAAVYRKPAGASDAEYVRLDDLRQPLAPLNRDQIHEIMLKFQIPGATAARTAPATLTAPTGLGLAAPPVPEEAPEMRLPTSSGAERAGEPAPGPFVFLDQTVDDGESYIYKIVTLSTALDVEPVPCEAPYVSPAPVSVPPLVAFKVLTVTGDRATVRLTRLDPDDPYKTPLSQDFTVCIGMKIGGIISLKQPPVPGLPPPEPRKVDFSTGCTLVSMLPTFTLLEYNNLRLRHVGDTYTVVYQIKVTRDPRILYLTPRGALHFKSKERPAALSPAGPSPMGEPSRNEPPRGLSPRGAPPPSELPRVRPGS